MKSENKAFKDLFNRPEDYELVFSSLEHTIWCSFLIDVKVLGRSVEITQDKVKERWKICEKWFRIMRGDMGFGLIRTLDTIPRALACELLNVEFTPEKEHASCFFKEDVGEIADRLS